MQWITALCCQHIQCYCKIWLGPVWLLQEYCVDAFAKVEFERLRWVAANQDQLRSDLYQGVADAVDADNTTIGRKYHPLNIQLS